MTCPKSHSYLLVGQGVKARSGPQEARILSTISKMKARRTSEPGILSLDRIHHWGAWGAPDLTRGSRCRQTKQLPRLKFGFCTQWPSGSSGWGREGQLLPNSSALTCPQSTCPHTRSRVLGHTGWASRAIPGTAHTCPFSAPGPLLTLGAAFICASNNSFLVPSFLSDC